MKISFGSDLHIEFAYLDIENKDNADVLVLAGDICVAEHWNLTRCDDFFNKCADEFEHVIYIMGNHEFYHGDIVKSFEFIKEKLSHRKNIHVLNNECLVIDGFKFVCSTLWTDCNNNDVMTASVIRNGMNDYKLIRNGDMKLTPEHTMKLHAESLEFIKREVNNDDNIIIVVTHHAPSMKSIEQDHIHDFRMNGAYKSDLDEFIEQNDIALYIHGHTHHCVNYMIDTTIVASNQRGYVGYESIANNFSLKTIELLANKS